MMAAAKQVKKIVNSLSCNPICSKYPKYLSCHRSYSVKYPEKIKKEPKITCSCISVGCFSPHQVGEVKISVRVNGKHIKGSPYSVAASCDYTSLSKRPSKIVNNDGGMGELWGIGCSRNGKWAVADESNHCVYLYDGEDQLVRKIGGEGFNSGQLYWPRGVTFDDEDDLYVTDGHRVQKFTTDGDYLFGFGKVGSYDGQLKCPVGLTVHNDKVYIADFNNDHVSVFLIDGRFHQTIGRRQFGAPCDVAVTSNDELLVVDWVDDCIYRYTLDGGYIGKLSDELRQPESITIDSNGFILVADGGNHRVVILDKFGNLVHKFGSRGSGGGKFLSPYGIAVNKNGNVYVSDYHNKRVQIFCY